MTYSSAMRCNPNDSLEQAQLNKYNRIIDVLSLEDKNVLEIGCGWGGFADQAHKIGANVTGITISDSQYRFAKDRLNDKAKILIKDYRDIDSKYDRIVSIEMFEAVGEKYWQTYFEKIRGSLVKGEELLFKPLLLLMKLLISTEKVVIIFVIMFSQVECYRQIVFFVPM